MVCKVSVAAAATNTNLGLSGAADELIPTPNDEAPTSYGVDIDATGKAEYRHTSSGG